MKRIILILLFALLSNIGISQSGWSAGNYYAYQGESVTQTSYQPMWNSYCLCYQNVLACRQLTWYQEYFEGYIYIWGPNGWYQEYRSGYYWYCYWSNWYIC